MVPLPTGWVTVVLDRGIHSCRAHHIGLHHQGGVAPVDEVAIDSGRGRWSTVQDGHVAHAVLAKIGLKVRARLDTG